MHTDSKHWLAGLIDGEGSFFIYPHHGTSWATGFSLRMRADDRPALELARDIAEVGRVNDHRSTASANRPNNKPSATWQVHSKADKLVLVRLLDEYPLRSKKAHDFAIWREAVLSGAGPHLAARLRAARQFERVSPSSLMGAS